MKGSKKKPLVVILLGKSGSGKGTQAKFLMEKLGLSYVGSGELLRARGRKRDFIGRKIHAMLSAGRLIPTAAIFKLWLDRVEKLAARHDFKGIVADGSPRKIIEAYLIDDVLAFFGWRDVHFLWIDISDREAIARLTARGRNDDALRSARNRLAWFKKEVHPILRYYKRTKRLIRIDGEQTPTDVFKDILTAI